MIAGTCLARSTPAWSVSITGTYKAKHPLTRVESTKVMIAVACLVAIAFTVHKSDDDSSCGRLVTIAFMAHKIGTC
jgi:hypothetical protein